MKITMTQNQTYGQLYLQRDDGQQLRVPRQSVDSFTETLESWGIPIQIRYNQEMIASRVWSVGQQFAG